MAALTGVKVIDMVGGEVSKISYNGEEYAKVSERGDEIHANPGDILLRINHAEDYARIGDYFAVNSDRRIVDREDDEIRPHLKHYAIFEKVLAGSADKLAELESRIAALEATQQAPATTQSEHYRKVTDRSPQVGDYVKYDEAPESYLTSGKYYEITHVGGRSLYHLDDEGDGEAAIGEGFEVYEKVDQVSAEQPQPLKVGDYAKVVDEIHGHNFAIGSIITLTSLDEDGAFKAADLSGSQSWYVESPELAPATDEEVAEAKRQAEKGEADRTLSAKFAEIGRNPGEFKAGDIVRVKDTLMTTFLTVDQIAEVVSYDAADRNPRVKADDGGTRYAKVELITPVERRFDR